MNTTTYSYHKKDYPFVRFLTKQIYTAMCVKCLSSKLKPTIIHEHDTGNLYKLATCYHISTFL